MGFFSRDQFYRVFEAPQEVNIDRETTDSVTAYSVKKNQITQYLEELLP